MKISCFFRHSWEGCKCKRCETTRDEIGTHTWNGCICLRCGKKRDHDHDWSTDCTKCARCGGNADRLASCHYGEVEGGKWTGKLKPQYEHLWIHKRMGLGGKDVPVGECERCRKVCRDPFAVEHDWESGGGVRGRIGEGCTVCGIEWPLITVY